MRRLTDEEIVKLWRVCEARTAKMAEKFDIPDAVLSGFSFRGVSEEECDDSDEPVSFVFETWCHIPGLGFMASTAFMGEDVTPESMVDKLIAGRS